jgi:hypothetical protein
VTFETTTRFRDSIEGGALGPGGSGGAGGEDIRRLPDQAGNARGGRGLGSKASPGNKLKAKKGLAGRAPVGSVAAAAEEAMRLLANVRLEPQGKGRQVGGKPQGRPPQQRPGVAALAPPGAAVPGGGRAGVRYETRTGVGGGVFTYAQLTPAASFAEPSSRALVSQYLTGAPAGQIYQAVGRAVGGRGGRPIAAPNPVQAAAQAPAPVAGPTRRSGGA